MDRLEAATAKLRNQVDISGISPRDGSAGWLREVCNVALGEPGALAILGRNKLTSLGSTGVRGDALIDSAAILISAICVLAGRKKHHLAVAVPSGARHFPLFSAVVGILSDAVRDSCLGLPHDNSVLIISSDLDLRARYATLQVADASVDAAYPGSRLGPSGKVDYINYAIRRSHKGLDYLPGVCFMYPTRRLPDVVDLAPRYVIVDLRYGREGLRCTDLLRWSKEKFSSAGLIAIFTMDDEYTEDQVRRIIPDLILFDHQAIATTQQQCQSNNHRVTMSGDIPTLDASFDYSIPALERQNRLSLIEEPTKLARLLAAIDSALFKATSGHDDPAIRRAKWLYSTIRDFPLPLKYYEAAALESGRYTIRRMLESLDRLTTNPFLRPIVQSVFVQLEECYKLLLEDSPREAALIDAVEDAFLGDASSIVIFCKDATALAAIELWLRLRYKSEVQLLARVHAARFADAGEMQGRRIGVAILSGVLPVQHRWMYEGNLGHLAVYICTKEQNQRIASLLEVPFSPLHNARAVNSRYKAISEMLVRRVPVTGTDSALGKPLIIGAVPTATFEPSAESQPKTDGISTVPVPPRKKLRSIGRGLESLGLLMGLQGEASESEMPATQGQESLVEMDLSEEDEPADDLSAIGNRLGRRVVGLLRCSPVQVVLDERRQYDVIPDSDNARLASLFPGQLTPGDTLLLTDSETRSSIFDQMLSILESKPRLQALSSYRRAWNAAVRRLRDEGSNADAPDCALLLKKLRLAGANIESELTVRNWIDGSVIGPAKASSIRAVGQVIGAIDMVTNTANYDQAFRAIRTIHQTLGRQINAILHGAKQDMVSGIASDEYDLNALIGLPLVELLETITPIRIESIDEKTSAVSSTGIGTLSSA